MKRLWPRKRRSTEEEQRVEAARQRGDRVKRSAFPAEYAPIPDPELVAEVEAAMTEETD
jgi:hypothetical protein